MAVGQWKKYYVHLAGNTGGSHQEFLFYVSRAEQMQVFTPAESDYVLIFCPVFSEPAREVEQALVNFPVGKPTILLVMHHQSESVPRNQTHVTSPNVYLTLDILHYQGNFKRCQPNTVAVNAVIMLIKASYRNRNRKVAVIFVTVSLIILVLVVVATTAIRLT